MKVGKMNSEKDRTAQKRCAGMRLINGKDSVNLEIRGNS